MRLKIAPVVNGSILNIPLNDWELRDKTQNCMGPDGVVTAVMLSHIWDLKDIITAIESAHYIVNVLGVDCYRLKIYGNTEKSPAYTKRCKELIVENDLGNHVFLCGLGKPADVLRQGDIFVNSSVSEGLPMALIESGLAGLLNAATDVGGSGTVVAGFGGVVPPCDGAALGKLQLEVLCMDAGRAQLSAPDDWRCDWSQATFDSDVPYGDVLAERMRNPEVVHARRAWGRRYREYAFQHFSLQRYSYEHHMQMRLVAEQSRERIASLADLTASGLHDELGMGEQMLDASPFLAYRGIHGMLKRHGALLAQPIFGRNFKNTVDEMQALARRFPQEAAEHATRFPEQALMLGVAFPELALDGAKGIVQGVAVQAVHAVQDATSAVHHAGHLATGGVQVGAHAAVAGTKAVHDLANRVSQHAQGQGRPPEIDIELGLGEEPETLINMDNYFLDNAASI